MWKTRHHVVVKIYIIVRKEKKNETFLAVKTIEVPLPRLQQTTWTWRYKYLPDFFTQTTGNWDIQSLRGTFHATDSSF